jgi:hypothetical protein
MTMYGPSSEEKRESRPRARRDAASLRLMAWLDEGLRSWWSISLPGREQDGTYVRADVAHLPPPPPCVDRLDWLEATADDGYDGISTTGEDWGPTGEPNTETLDVLISDLDINLPKSFARFIADQSLQRRVPSTTACYLDLGDTTVSVADNPGTHLIHFLSDQQFVLHWLLAIDESGNEAVIVSDKGFGIQDAFFDDDADDDLFGWGESRPDRIVGWPSGTEICAGTFAEFLWRFWIENKLCHSLWSEPISLPPDQQAYLTALRAISDRP